MNDNDREIILLLQQNDEKGYEMMIHKYSAYVGAIVYNISAPYLSKSDMEELAGDVFFKIWKTRTSLQGDHLKGLLSVTSRNTCLNALKTTRLPTIPIELDGFQPADSDPLHSIYERKEQMEIINHSVNTFGEPDREIFIRFYYFGEKMNQISEELSINLSTVKTKLRRCKEKLRTALHEGGYEYE